MIVVFEFVVCKVGDIVLICLVIDMCGFVCCLYMVGFDLLLMEMFVFIICCNVYFLFVTCEFMVLVEKYFGV